MRRSADGKGASEHPQNRSNSTQVLLRASKDRRELSLIARNPGRLPRILRRVKIAPLKTRPRGESPRRQPLS